MHYTPHQEIFDKMKETAIEIWQTYDNTYGYVDEKINKINSIENYKDNAMVFYRMFDCNNQFIFRARIKKYYQVFEYIKNHI